MLLRFRKSRKRLGNPRNQQVRIREPDAAPLGAKQRKPLRTKTFAYANGEFPYANPRRAEVSPSCRRASAVLCSAFLRLQAQHPEPLLKIPSIRILYQRRDSVVDGYRSNNFPVQLFGCNNNAARFMLLNN